MTIADATEVLVKARAYYPVNQVPEEVCAFYAADLADEDPCDLTRAMADLRRSLKWFPALSEIIDACSVAKNARELRARKLAAAIERVALLDAQLVGECPVIKGAGLGTDRAGKVKIVRTLVILGHEYRVEFGLLVGDRLLPASVADGDEAAWIEIAKMTWRNDVARELAAAEREVVALGGGEVKSIAFDRNVTKSTK